MEKWVNDQVVQVDLSHRHPSVQHVAQFFDWSHLPPALAEVSEKCSDLAQEMLQLVTDNPELTEGLRKLMEAKDAFVRAAKISPATEDAEG